MTTALRALALLDEIDQRGAFTVNDLVARGHTRASVFRYVRDLMAAGLLTRVRGAYIAGPRYNPQPPGTRFDEQSRRAAMLAEIARLREMRVPYQVIADRLNISVVKLRKLRDADR